MEQYIKKSAVENILRNLWQTDNVQNSEHRICYNKALQEVQCELDTLEVTTQSSNTNEALEKFKTLQHITGDKKSTVEDWAYTPNLYHFDGSWHVDWISCEEGDSLIGFSA